MLMVSEDKLRGCLKALYKSAYVEGYRDSELGEAQDPRGSESIEIIIEECKKMS